MTERQAALTTMHEYNLRREGLEKKIQRDWELARWKVWRTIAPFCKQIGQTPQVFHRFPWEESEAQERKRKADKYRVTEQQAEALTRFFECLAKQNNVNN